MNSLHAHEKAVRESHAAFAKTFGEIRSRTQFPAITHEALSLLNLRGKGSPLLIAGAAAGIAWIFGRFIKRRKARSVNATKLQTIK
jgi:hypothetical protein